MYVTHQSFYVHVSYCYTLHTFPFVYAPIYMYLYSFRYFVGGSVRHPTSELQVCVYRVNRIVYLNGHIDL